ncbi:XylR N-terminal domain-containing protein [Thalassobacillus devorans]|uniref:XylR N-terminal domain-containing protein n=1 Tax=Thalassobacillus devorans TaxID=279813 RepID=UPI00048E5DF4|nr:XylR N-terminal domain-containing protein [Thalassobacillus devorans]
MKKPLELERDLKLADDGLIYTEDNRAILVPTSSFGILRKDLYTNIGKERVKGFLMRYGSDLGRKDAKIIQEKFNHESKETIIKKGPIYHQLQGHVVPTLTKIKVEHYDDKVSTYIEGTWEHSYEAEEHIEQFGISDEPVCNTLVGYASGFLSEVCNQTVLFKEVSCVGKGDEVCKWVGRTVDYWTNEMNDELKYYKEEPIVKELELTYEKLLEERNYLKKASVIYNQLTEEILKGKDLDTIMDFVYNLTKTAILIESPELQLIASGGVPNKDLDGINHSFFNYIHNKNSMKKTLHQTKIIKLEEHKRIVTPIFLQGKIIGYCSFVYYEDSEEEKLRFLQMIIERISSICALYILNKKTETEAEERMKGRFLEQILNGEYTNEEILRRGSFIGLDLFQPYYIVVINFQKPNQNYKEELTFLEEVKNESTMYFQRFDINILLGQQANDLVLLFLKSEIADRGIKATCTKYLDHLSNLYPSVVFSAGISMQSNKIENASNSYHEAVTSQRMTTNKNNVIEFQTLGILGPLINSNNEEEVKRIAIYTLRPLCDDLDDDKKMETIKTLYMYLLNGGNLEQTATDMALSLSGLRYRIRKIEDLMEQDLRNPEVSYKLLLSIQALLSIGKINISNY